MYLADPDNYARWYECNKRTQSQRYKRWALKHVKERQAKSAKERAARIQRTPAWADLKAIKEFYKQVPNGHHVDHIIPLQGKTVSGLHVIENLQYLPIKENLRKGNLFNIQGF